MISSFLAHPESQKTTNLGQCLTQGKIPNIINTQILVITNTKDK